MKDRTKMWIRLGTDVSCACGAFIICGYQVSYVASGRAGSIAPPPWLAPIIGPVLGWLAFLVSIVLTRIYSGRVSRDDLGGLAHFAHPAMLLGFGLLVLFLFLRPLDPFRSYFPPYVGGLTGYLVYAMAVLGNECGRRSRP